MKCASTGRGCAESCRKKPADASTSAGQSRFTITISPPSKQVSQGCKGPRQASSANRMPLRAERRIASRTKLHACESNLTADEMVTSARKMRDADLSSERLRSMRQRIIRMEDMCAMLHENCSPSATRVGKTYRASQDVRHHFTERLYIAA